MPYYLKYSMWSGSTTRMAETRDEAIQAVNEIRLAGGTVVEILDGHDRKLGVAELRDGNSPAFMVRETPSGADIDE